MFRMDGHYYYGPPKSSKKLADYAEQATSVTDESVTSTDPFTTDFVLMFGTSRKGWRNLLSRLWKYKPCKRPAGNILVIIRMQNNVESLSLVIAFSTIASTCLEVVEQ